MYAIAPASEVNRFTAKSVSSTRSPSPVHGSPASKVGSLSPPPPSHYLRDHTRSREESDESIKRLRKKSDIYEARRSRSRSRGNSTSQSHFYLPESAHSPKLSGSGSKLGHELTAQSSQEGSLSFLATDPSTPFSSSAALFSDSTFPSTTGQRRSSDSQAFEKAPIWDYPSTGSRRGSVGANNGRLGYLRHSSKDSLVSTSSSSHCPTSLDPHTTSSPPAESLLFVPFSPNSHNLSTALRPHHCNPEACKCEAPSQPSPRTPDALYDVQKRRRAQLLDQFTNYTEVLPFNRQSRGPHHLNADNPEMLVHGSESLLSTRSSEPDLRSASIREKGPLSDMSSASGLATPEEDESADGSFRRRNCVMKGLKSLLTPKNKPSGH